MPTPLHSIDVHAADDGSIFLYCSCGGYTDYYPNGVKLDELNRVRQVHVSRLDTK